MLITKQQYFESIPYAIKKSAFNYYIKLLNIKGIRLKNNRKIVHFNEEQVKQLDEYIKKKFTDFASGIRLRDIFEMYQKDITKIELNQIIRSIRDELNPSIYNGHVYYKAEDLTKIFDQIDLILNPKGFIQYKHNKLSDNEWKEIYKACLDCEEQESIITTDELIRKYKSLHD